MCASLRDDFPFKFFSTYSTQPDYRSTQNYPTKTKARVHLSLFVASRLFSRADSRSGVHITRFSQKSKMCWISTIWRKMCWISFFLKNHATLNYFFVEARGERIFATLRCLFFLSSRSTDPHTTTHAVFVDLHAHHRYVVQTTSTFVDRPRCKAHARRGGVDLFGHSACDENRHAHTPKLVLARRKNLFFKRARWENERRKKLLVSFTSCTSKSSSGGKRRPRKGNSTTRTRI